MIPFVIRWFGKGGILSLLGCAYLIDPTCYNQKIFSDAIDLLPKESQDSSVSILKAFALQYWALVLHRKARINKSREIDPTALINIKTAIGLQEKLLDKFPLIKIGLAESIHIHALMLNRLGEINSDQTYFNEADGLFRKAIELEKIFCHETGSSHFLTAITQQSHAMVLINLNQYHEAVNQLEDALLKQQSMSQPLIDIAKSYHFIGDAYTKMEENVLAIEFYRKALVCKMQIQYDQG